MSANKVVITSLPCFGGGGGGVRGSHNLLSDLPTLQRKTVMRGRPSEPARWGMHVQSDVSGVQKWHIQSLAFRLCSVSAARGREGQCAFPHTCVDTEALAAPDPHQSFTPSFAVLSAMASRTAPALSLAHTVDLAALSLEFNRNLSCWISHFTVLHRPFVFFFF